MIRRTEAAALLMLLSACAPADPADRFARGDYEGALRGYRQALAEAPASPVVHYDLGATHLRLPDYETARPHLEIAARTGDAAVRQRAFYNLGNAHLEPAFREEIDDARQALARAIVAYKRALLLDPDDADAKWNLELARRLLRQELESPRPRPEPSAGGGGGGEGGGGGSDADPGGGAPRRSAAAPGASSPRLSRSEAERVLDSAEERERAIQREKLARPQPPVISH